MSYVLSALATDPAPFARTTRWCAAGCVTAGGGALFFLLRRRFARHLAGALHAVLKEHVVLGGEANAGPHEVSDGLALREERVDHRRPRRGQGRLDQEGEQGEDGVKALEVVVAILPVRSQK